MNDIVVIYNGEPVLVSREVADYLEEERKRDQAETRQDRRHLSKSEFETVSDCAVPIRRPVEDACIKNLRLEKLRRGAICRRCGAVLYQRMVESQNYPQVRSS